MTPDQLATLERIKGRMEKATPRPWYWETKFRTINNGPSEEDDHIICWCCYRAADDPNYSLIPELVNAAPWMIPALERQGEYDAEIASLREQLIEAQIKPTRDYLKSPAMKTFAELKHSKAGTILALLQDGAISRSKACEALAELAHGVPFDEIPLPDEKGNQFGEDEIPAEVCARQQDEIASIRERIAELEKAIDIVCGSAEDMWGYGEDLRNGTLALKHRSAIDAARAALDAKEAG